MDRKFYRDYLIFLILVTGIMIAIIILADKMIVHTSTTEITLTRRCFVIDAGHGGEDGGAVSVTGIPESKYNLEIAIRLNDLLRLLGYQTRMLRTEDRDLHTEGTTIAQRKRSDLKQRVSIINSIPNAVVLSIHQNFFSDSRYSGMQVFYADTPGSRELAKHIQTGYTNTVSPTCRRLAQKVSNVYLMDHLKCTAVLIECGFISNTQEEELLKDRYYQNKLCIVIASSIVNAIV